MTLTRWIMKLIGLIILAGIFTICLQTRPQQIQSDLLQKARNTLEENDFSWAMVSIDGRDVTLSGIAPDDVATELAINAVSRIPGVRVVNNEIYPANTSGSGSPLRSPEPLQGLDLSLTEPTRAAPFPGASQPALAITVLGALQLPQIGDTDTATGGPK